MIIVWEKTNLRNAKSGRETKRTNSVDDAQDYKKALKDVEDRIKQIEQAKQKSKTMVELNSQNQFSNPIPQMNRNVQCDRSASKNIESDIEKASDNHETYISNEKEEDEALENTSNDSDIIIIEPPPPEVIVLDDDVNEDSHVEKVEDAGFTKTDEIGINVQCESKEKLNGSSEQKEGYTYNHDDSGSIHEDQNDSNEQNMELEDSVVIDEVGGDEEEEGELEVYLCFW